MNRSQLFFALNLLTEDATPGEINHAMALGEAEDNAYRAGWYTAQYYEGDTVQISLYRPATDPLATRNTLVIAKRFPSGPHDDVTVRTRVAELFLAHWVPNPVDPPVPGPIKTPAVKPPSIAQQWPHVKLIRPVQVGQGNTRHGSLGVVTACGRVWRETLGTPHDAHTMIDCAVCVRVLDKRNTENRRASYAVRVSEEQDAFAAGVPVADATAWRAKWYAGDFTEA